jgi:polysaccharide biosynthesis/export protein
MRAMSMMCRVAVASLSMVLLGQSRAQTPADYTLGPEDVLTVTVLRHPELSGDFLVTDAGNIQVPAAGAINVNGLTLPAVANILTTKLKVRLKKPEVSVSLKVPRQQRIYVLGEVRLPGIVNFKSGWTISQAIAAAGGLTPGIQLEDLRVILDRPGQRPVSIPLAEVLSDDGDKKYTLMSGDTLRFDSMALKTVYVTGKVKVPGMYRLRSDGRGVLAAIAQAGGALDDASLENVRIYRLNGADATVDLTPALISGSTMVVPTLETGDMVVVPESTSRFAVLGWVAKPGLYPIPNGRTYTLAEAVATASGGLVRSRFSKVGILSTKDGKQTRTIYDLGRFLVKGDETQNPTIHPGDVVFVPETNRVDISVILGALSSTSLLVNATKR